MGAPTVSVTSNDGAPMEAPELLVTPVAINKDRLRSLFERILAREQAKREAAEDIRDLYKEAGSAGYNPDALRELVGDQIGGNRRLAKRDRTAADKAILRAALGDFSLTPLGRQMQ